MPARSSCKPVLHMCKCVCACAFVYTTNSKWCCCCTDHQCWVFSFFFFLLCAYILFYFLWTLHAFVFDWFVSFATRYGFLAAPLLILPAQRIFFVSFCFFFAAQLVVVACTQHIHKCVCYCFTNSYIFLLLRFCCKSLKVKCSAEDVAGSGGKKSILHGQIVVNFRFDHCVFLKIFKNPHCAATHASLCVTRLYVCVFASFVVKILPRCILPTAKIFFWIATRQILISFGILYDFPHVLCSSWKSPHGSSRCLLLPQSRQHWVGSVNTYMYVCMYIFECLSPW